MKSKALILFSTLAMAFALMAQTATTPSAPAGDDTKNCAGCNHDQADGKAACCGKHAGCCSGKDAACCKGGSCCQGKDGKACAMMSKDQNGNMTCCAGGKCAMTSKDQAGQKCCGGNKCERPQAGA
jgi:hypothetical protein